MAGVVTASDIARKVGVSQPVVSAALSGKIGGSVRVGRKTSLRIQKVARDLGYRTNLAARAVSTGRFGSVALVLSTTGAHSTLHGDLIAGLHAQLEEARTHLIVLKMSDAQLTDPDYAPRLLTEAGSDGLLIDYTHAIPPRMMELIERHHIPAVWINSKHSADCVHPDDEGAGYEATRKLLAFGHRRIAYAEFCYLPDAHGLHPDEPHYSVLDRPAGYARAMREAGLEPRIEKRCPLAAGELGDFLAYARALLAGDATQRPSALLGYASDRMIPCFTAAMMAGLKVPGDLSLVSIDSDAVPFLGTLFSTLLLPHEAVGRAAGRMMLEKLDHPGKRLPPVAVPFAFEPGQTLADVPSA